MNQKGVAHIFLILFLLAGLAVGVYLVQQKTNILPKAFENTGVSTCGYRISKFSVDKPCGEVPDGFKSAKYSCRIIVETEFSEQTSEDARAMQSVSPEETCRSLDDWVSRARNKCASMCSNQTSPVPTFPASPFASPISALPPAPDRLMGVCPSPGTSANLAWNPIPGASRYYHRVVDLDGDNIWSENIKTVKAEAVYSTIYGHQYWWIVSACTPAGCSEWSKPVAFECGGTSTFSESPSLLIPDRP